MGFGGKPVLINGYYLYNPVHFGVRVAISGVF